MEELESILKSIRENLTGNSQKDIKYRQGCMELYRDHPLHREIGKRYNPFVEAIASFDCKEEAL